MKLSFYLNSLITPPCFFPIVAIAGRQSIFGSQVIGGYQDAQSFDHRDATTDPENFELFRNLDEVAGENAEDNGTHFEDIRDGLNSSEAKKAIIYSEILARKY